MRLAIASMSAFLGLLSVQAFAQSPIAELPPGQPTAGWAVEVMANRENDKIETLLDERGVARLSIPAGRIDAAPLSKQYGLMDKTAHGGRAFLRVDEGGPYTFSYLFIRNARHTGPCQIHLVVGGQKVISEMFNPQPQTQIRFTGNVRLARGVYPVQYVHRCAYVSGGSEGTQSEIYDIQVRGPDDDAPRTFRSGELFHVRR